MNPKPGSPALARSAGLHSAHLAGDALGERARRLASDPRFADNSARRENYTGLKEAIEPPVREPRLGEHTGIVPGDLPGLGAAEIEALWRTGIL